VRAENHGVPEAWSWQPGALEGIQEVLRSFERNDTLDILILPGRIMSIKLLKLTALIGMLTLALWAPAAQAYYMESVGSLVSADTSQLTTSGAFGLGEGKHNNGFQIAWQITEAGPGKAFHYEYTISGVDGAALGKTLSHWNLEVSNPSSRSNFTNFNGIQAPYDGQYVPATWRPKQGSPGQPGDLYGIRFNSGQDYVKAGTQTYTFSFDTFCVPVWGDFYAKSGNGVYAYNTGFGTNPHLLTTDFNPWLMVPGTKSLTPLPGSVLLLGFGLAGLALARFRLRQKKT
jgi:hypothetical protein